MKDSCQSFYLEEQTWDMFEKEMKEKKVVLFGVGILTSLCFFRFPNIQIELVVDNDIEKQGETLEEYVFGSVSKRKEIITTFAELKKMNPQEIVILISSIQHAEEIKEQLNREGFLKCYSLNKMEENQPTDFPGVGENASERLMNMYIGQCCQYAVEKKKLVIYEHDYVGHGKQIMEQLLAIRKDMDIVWVVNDLSIEAPLGVRKISARKILQFYYEMETAHCWLIGNTIPSCIQKREGQIYIQVKHWASITLKTFGFDFYEFRKIQSGIKLMEHNSRAMDYIITGSKFDEETCRNGFHFWGPVFEAGSPRTDILFEEEKYKEIVYKKYNIKKESKVLLYAPTFRDGTEEKFLLYQYEAMPDFRKLRENLQKTYSSEWVIMLRLHPSITTKSIECFKEEFVIDVSDYKDSQELIAASDMMITDYSSIMFEPAFVHKPVILFAPDREEYINRGRKLLIDYDALPFDITKTDEELSKAITNFNQQEYDERLNTFFEQYGVHEDGHASERAAVFVSSLID